MKIKWKAVILMAALGAVTAPDAFAQNYEITWYTIDGGGAMASAGGAYELSGTIGQPDASMTPAAGGNYQLTSGFWTVAVPSCPVTAPADFDQDCDVDLVDLQAFAACAQGADVAVEAGCEDKSLDGDGDADQSDFGILQRCYSGTNTPADPNCAN